MNTNTQVAPLSTEVRAVVVSTALATLAARVSSIQEARAACRRAVKAIDGSDRVRRGDGQLIDALCDEVRLEPAKFATMSTSVTSTTLAVAAPVDMSETNGLLAQIIALLQALLVVCTKGFASQDKQLPAAKVMDAEFDVLPEAKAASVAQWTQVQPLPVARTFSALPQTMTAYPALPTATASESTALAVRSHRSN